MPPTNPLATPTTRFAPSPTGLLHLGSAYAAVKAYKHARNQNGRFLLRIEDIDQTRCRPEYTQAIKEDLTWLGLQWDGPVRIQSHHLPDYRTTLDRLEAMALLYPCFCTRADIAAAATAPHGPNPAIYPGTCRHLSPAQAHDQIAQGVPYAIRLDLAKALARTGPLTYLEAAEGRLRCDPTPLGDPVLARKDIPASYHLCVTHDDALQAVTTITRGNDLRPATGLHRLLQTLLDWPEPAYAHHALLKNDQGQRLAKRDHALSLRALRDAHCSPADIIAEMTRRTGTTTAFNPGVPPL